MQLKPLQDFESTALRHLQIGNQDTWKWECLPVGVATGSLQVSHAIFSIVAYVHWHLNTVFLERSLQDEHIVLIIFQD